MVYFFSLLLISINFGNFPLKPQLLWYYLLYWIFHIFQLLSWFHFSSHFQGRLVLEKRKWRQVGSVVGVSVGVGVVEPELTTLVHHRAILRSDSASRNSKHCYDELPWDPSSLPSLPPSVFSSHSSPSLNFSSHNISLEISASLPGKATFCY